MRVRILGWLAVACLLLGAVEAYAFDNFATSFMIAKATKKKSGKKHKTKSKPKTEQPSEEKKTKETVKEKDSDKEKEKEKEKDPLDSKKAKKKRKSLGIVLSGGYEDADWSEGEAKYSLGGLGFGGGLNYSLNMHDKISVPISAGVHMLNISGENDIGTLTLSATNIFLEIGVDAWLGRSFAIGGLVGMDLFMSGSYSFEYKDGSQEKKSLKVQAYNRMVYGLGGRLFVTDSIKIFGDFLLTAGSFKEEPLVEGQENTATKFSGKVLRLGLGFYFL